MSKKKAVQITINMPAKLYEQLEEIVILPFASGSIEKEIINCMYGYLDTVIAVLRREMGDEDFNMDYELVTIEKQRSRKNAKQRILLRD